MIIKSISKSITLHFQFYNLKNIFQNVNNEELLHSF